MVDDGSADNTREVMRRLSEKHPEIRIFCHDVNKGGGAARNTAVENSKADLIFCLDGDDILPKNVLRKMIKLMEKKNCDGVLFEETRFFSAQDTTKTEIIKNIKNEEVPISFSDMFKKNIGFLAKVNFLYTKKAYQVSGGYPTHHGFDTQTFGFRFLSKGLKAYVCPNTYYLHRRHAKVSYFDREYRKGNFSLNTYLMYEDFLYLFSRDVREIIINFDILRNKKIDKNSLDQIITYEYSIKGSNIFVSDYEKYLNKNGEALFFQENLTSLEPTQVFIRALFLSRKGEGYPARILFLSLKSTFPNSEILKLKTRKKIVLLMHNGGRLGNQLWLMAAFYAYCIEKGYIFDIRCFFEYQEYFDIKVESRSAEIFGKTYAFFERRGVPESILRDIFYGIFTVWAEVFSMIRKKFVIFDADEATQKSFKIFVYKRYNTILRIITNLLHVVLQKEKEVPFAYAKTHNPSILFLPPSDAFEPFNSRDYKVYFYGWLFRNPNGIIKYQKRIAKFLTPKKEIDEKVIKYIKSVKKSYQHVIGVHIRLGDVVNEFMNNDRIAYSEAEVNGILKEFLNFSGYSPKETCFILCSDGKIAESNFKGLNVNVTKNNPVSDYWLLSKTDIIIGADSSFAVISSFVGDVPFIVFKRGIDWGYYKNKKKFFVNKYVSRFIY